MSLEKYNRINIYLAGKISGNDWRSDIMPDLKERLSDDELIEHTAITGRWPVVEECIFDRFNYVGPYRVDTISDKSIEVAELWDKNFGLAGKPEGYSHRFPYQTQHSVPEDRYLIVTYCIKAIQECDLFFAWINSFDAYGTFVEIGLAKALGKDVCVCIDRELNVDWWKSDLWFMCDVADSSNEQARNPSNCLKYELYKRGYFCDSPIEKQLFQAFDWKVSRPECQHQIGKYRADLAYPSVKLAIECDGHEYHKSKDQRTHDARRDRYFKSEGWEVLRFTGSEIHKDAKACAEEVKQAYERLSADRKVPA